MNEKDPYLFTSEIVSRVSAEDFNPDGNLDKRVWQAADRVVFDHDWMGSVISLDPKPKSQACGLPCISISPSGAGIRTLMFMRVRTQPSKDSDCGTATLRRFF